MNKEIDKLDEINKNLYTKYIVLSSIVCVGILFLIEQVLMVDYFMKTLSKIVLFILTPIILIKVIKKTSLKEGLNIKIVDKKTINLGLVLGLLAGIILISAFIIFKKFINMEAIFLELETKSKITERNYFIVTTYFSFCNSFLEEFFFRGFIFINLLKMGYRKFAYIFSAGLFSLYHIGIFINWFNLELFLLCLLGLFIAGIVFDYVDAKSENFINSWAIHIIADITIVIIGYIHLF